MLSVLVAPEGIAFTAALVLMLLIGLVEAVGLGASAVDLDLGADVGHDGVLGWFGIGRVPLLVLLVAFLATFGILGLAGQQALLAATGHLLSPWLAVPAAALVSLPATALLARGLARVMPRDETTAVPLDTLVGLTGTVLVGRAAQGSPARARVTDPHGQAHHVMVEPDVAGTVFEESDVVLLVRREGAVFRAVTHDLPRFSNWIDR